MSAEASSAVRFLAEWAIRSTALISAGVLLLRIFRVKAPRIALAAYIALLGASVALPLLTAALPGVALSSIRVPVGAASALPVDPAWLVLPRASAGGETSSPAAQRSVDFDWASIAFVVYVGIAGLLLLRLTAALAVSAVLHRRSRPAGIAAGGVEIRESDEIRGPLAIGIARPAILLPCEWRDWDVRKLEAVLAHERSHIERHDPAVQLVSALHRAILWHSPGSWLLHRRIVRAAEEASDDAGVAASRDRASYAQILLELVRSAPRAAYRQGVAMARYVNLDARIDRILEAAAPSPGITRKSAAALLVLGFPLVFLSAASHLKDSGARRSLRFQTVTIRRAAAGERPGPLRPLPGGDGYSAQDVPLKVMISLMYKVPARQIEGAPAWLDSDGFDIEAKADHAHPLDDLHAMFRNLLAERFHLAFHKQTRPGPVYVLGVASSGSKMEINSGGDLSRYAMSWGKGGVMTGVRVSMEYLAWWLSENAPGEKRAVIDRTGLRQNYDFTLKFAPQFPPGFARDKVPAEVFARPSIFDALRQQLGLTLTGDIGPVEYLVIDRVERAM